MEKQITREEVAQRIEGNLARTFGISPSQATESQMYNAVASTVKNLLLEKRKEFNSNVKAVKAKKVYYLCMEFLLGRSLKTNLHNLGITDKFEGVLKDFGFSLEKLYDNEPDAGLGNGGLGRLAACYMDSLASLDYPAMGFSIRYDYGLFKQKLVDGWQTELPDIWLPGGEVWLTPRPDKNTVVRFGGKVVTVDKGNNRLEFEHVGYKEVEAMAYDMMISGANCEGVSVLRLWRARNISKFNMSSFSQGDYYRAMQEDNEAELISKVLYPSDEHAEGKTLRLKQQYFLVCASVNNIIRDIMRMCGDVRRMPEYAAIHINDTHPALCIPELMRVLMDDYSLSWDEAWSIVTKTVNYTNHTVLAEALECWSMELFSETLPRIWQIVCEIDKRYREETRAKGFDNDTVNRTAVIDYGAVKMANLSCIASSKVNGVSALHSEILKTSVFKDYNKIYPNKLMNVTNGIAHRRWLCYSNPRLSSLLSDCIGDGFINNATELKKFEAFKDDKATLDKLAEIKHANKVDLANYIARTQGVEIDPASRFDVQAKRLHEYKRQLLNVLKIIDLYEDLLENPDLAVTPQTFIFAAKAAPSYYRAKEIIKLICYLQRDIAHRPKIREKLNVVFLENYSVTMAEMLMPASEISEQISTAGKEASGTGNMKFMINGAVTLGTLDGANVEIKEAVGDDNIFIFGYDAKDIANLWAKGYSSFEFYNRSPKLKKIVERLNIGFDGESFANISSYLLNSQGIADPYMCLADFESYSHIAFKMDKAYRDKDRFNKMSLINIANAGRFAADRAIEEYAKEIWHLDKVTSDK